ncbi:hypothetical protein HPP92_018176 [Vanilla planifolia]|uniref:Copper transport protein n=1 Tax=Vanilla planifolia TaxID=51239 RepID=A0A835Q591_VANPL|nr:hypothetical protein HPP92_018176 [Vanilla planifolia]
MEDDAGRHGGTMHMTLFWGKRVQILFSGWPDSRGLAVYLISLLLVAVAAAITEVLGGLVRRLAPSPSTSLSRRILSGTAGTAFHAFRMSLLYLVMLAVMSFNVGVLIAAVVGHAAGFFIFGSGVFRWAWGRPGGPEAYAGRDYAKH